MSKDMDVRVRGIKPSSGSRWWEFYFVRYFAGTVIGVAILLFLNFSDTAFHQVLFPGVSGLSDLTQFHYLLVGALGLTYCYVASAPILLLHGFRGDLYLHKDDEMVKEWKDKKKWGYKIRLILAVSLALTISAVVFVFLWSITSSELVGLLSKILINLAISIIIFIQVFPAIFALSNGFRVSFNYYSELAYMRSKRVEGTTPFDEYVESYRHLREHGNAYFILFLELILGIFLTTVDSPQQGISALILWILPGMFIWFWGNGLESMAVREMKKSSHRCNSGDGK